MGEMAVTVDHVSKMFRLYHDRNQSLKATLMRGRRARYEEFQALDDVSIEVPVGTTYGLIGENGSGKSTLLKCMARILRPESGSITVNGKISALLELGAGFHPELSGKENIYLNGAILGLGSKDIDRKYDDIVEFAGLEQFIDTPVKNYSSGMYVRLGFSVAINVDPDVLLVDEVLAVGDEQFQRRCNEKFAELRAQDKTIVVVSHGLGLMRTICDELAWLEHGKLRMAGPAGDVVDQYLAEVQTDRHTDAGTDGNGARWGSGEARIDDIAPAAHR
jgi:ABC-type polysaccharide/polyol phosphate transport system ATPase subunit